MADIPESAIGEAKSSASAMSLAHQEDDRSRREASDGFVAIDIETLSILSANKGKDSTSSPRVHMAKATKHLSRKGSQRSGAGGERKAAEGQLANSPSGGPGMNVKSALSMHVADQEEPSEFSRAITPTAAGGMCRRQGRRQTPWIDPRRVLILFATLSSMGTLILLYLTLSMGKMAGSDTHAP